MALVTNDANGNVSVKETGDHLGRKGLEIGGGVGLVVGLLAPPLLASVIVGAAAGGLIGKFARHRVESGLEDKMGAALPPGSAGIVAIYDRAKASTERAAPAGELRPRFDIASIGTLAGIGCPTIPYGDPAARVTDQKPAAQADR